MPPRLKPIVGPMKTGDNESNTAFAAGHVVALDLGV